MEIIEENSLLFNWNDGSGDTAVITKKDDNDELMVSHTTNESGITAIFVQNKLEVLAFLVDYIEDRMCENKQEEDGGQVLARSEPEKPIDFMSEVIFQYGYVQITRLLALIDDIFEQKIIIQYGYVPITKT